MVTNWNLLPVISEMTKENNMEATIFAGLINKKEIKIVADCAIAIAALDLAEKERKIEVKPRWEKIISPQLSPKETHDPSKTM